MKGKEKELFEKTPVFEAVLKLVLPTVMGQIILVVYNMADTFFIGLTGSDMLITSVTISMPAFMFLSAISNLFGIGGAAAASRAMGRRNKDRVGNISAFALWGCVLVTGLYGFFLKIGMDPFVDLLGGSHPGVHQIAAEYLMITVALGGVFTSVNNLLSHLVRSEGRSLYSSIGIIMGGVLNIFLDPLFMFVILPAGNEVKGAAIATTLSNAISCLYFVILLAVLRKKGSLLSFRFNDDALEDGSFREILLSGLPACLMTLCENISYAVLDHLMAVSGVSYQAGIGVAKKVNMLAHSMVRGISQGVLPLIAYNYAAKEYSRMKKTIRTSSMMAVTVSVVSMVICFVFSRQLIGFFISGGGDSVLYGSRFLRILCVGCPFSAFAYAIISFLQAIGQNWKSFLLAILRKGLLDIPMMFVLGTLFPVYGIVAVTPITDMICCAVAVVFFVKCTNNLQEKRETNILKTNQFRTLLTR